MKMTKQDYRFLDSLAVDGEKPSVKRLRVTPTKKAKKMTKEDFDFLNSLVD